MGRVATLGYGVVVYAFFFATFLYLIGFVGDASFLPHTVNRGAVLTESTMMALVINLALLALFGVQHSVMARPAFKARWTRIIPHAIERSTYVLITSLILILMFWLWQPLVQTIWSVEATAGVFVLWALFFLGWGLVLLSTFAINHFDLFGLRQVWFHFRKETQPPIPFKTSGLYRLVRHPIYVGFILAFWSTPVMTLGHLVFALGMTVYAVVGVIHEERDLTAHFGDAYRDYRRRVPMLVPLPRLRASSKRDRPHP